MPTDPHTWPILERLPAHFEDGSKTQIVVRGEPPKTIQTLEGPKIVPGFHRAYFTPEGQHLNPTSKELTEFTIAENGKAVFLDKTD